MQKLNLPNKLTLIRMFLAPIYLALMLIEFPCHYIVALAVFAVASLTDMLDGKIARKNNLITVFGKLLDPLADKMLTTAALLAFMREGWCSIWIVMIVLTREFAVAGVRLIATAQGIVIPANYWGKAKTVSQMVFTIVIMLLAELDATFDIFANAGWFTLARVSNIMLWITAVLTVVSGITYFVDSKKLIDFSK
ncbi:MAG: CDP-diacylglycerol--glycerol-3-phosphate 3-phosphatidyltransferase [Acutalibacteraceae bacterium]|nr:CDP-diacylglycerol--glycerol-3-phosphate 3-phosphatidyltransferase [Acutalibacteraceae bacterium]MEE1426685.1 CDP-diacylglycerol--glycerol-3-phosphate 3-phosphatidyltransferase [Acutalibacteraceae bacterium]